MKGLWEEVVNEPFAECSRAVEMPSFSLSTQRSTVSRDVYNRINRVAFFEGNIGDHIEEQIEEELDAKGTGDD